MLFIFNSPYCNKHFLQQNSLASTNVEDGDFLASKQVDENVSDNIYYHTSQFLASDDPQIMWSKFLFCFFKTWWLRVIYGLVLKLIALYALLCRICISYGVWMGISSKDSICWRIKPDLLQLKRYVVWSFRFSTRCHWDVTKRSHIWFFWFLKAGLDRIIIWWSISNTMIFAPKCKRIL